MLRFSTNENAKKKDPAIPNISAFFIFLLYTPLCHHRVKNNVQDTARFAGRVDAALGDISLKTKTLGFSQ
ncbi:hypothetical protein LBYZC6_33640 [Lacrimispora brassicae]